MTHPNGLNIMDSTHESVRRRLRLPEYNNDTVRYDGVKKQAADELSKVETSETDHLPIGD